MSMPQMALDLGLGVLLCQLESMGRMTQVRDSGLAMPTMRCWNCSDMAISEGQELPGCQRDS
jgi:hypothetical protein